MTFDEVYRYDKDADTVMRMFADRGYFEKKYEETTISYEVLEHSSEGDRFHIRCKLSMPMNAPVPGFAKKFLGETMSVVQQDTWNTAARTGELKVEMQGAPIDISAKMELKQGASGAENHVHWNIHCKIPLVGGKIEKLIADDIRAKSPADLEVSNRILADY